MDRYILPILNSSYPVYRFRYEPVDSNMFFIPIGDAGVVFDPNVSKDLPTLFRQYGTKRVQIILTHEHYDHTTGVKWLQSLIEAPLFCHKECACIISSDKGNTPRLVAMALKTKDLVDGGHRCEDFLAQYVPYRLTADKTFVDHDIFTVGNITFECISTPGHSPGSACFIMGRNSIFTGDSLIQYSPTITRFRTSNQAIFESVTIPFLQSLNKNMLVFPGHGDPFIINEAKFI